MPWGGEWRFPLYRVLGGEQSSTEWLTLTPKWAEAEKLWRSTTERMSFPLIRRGSPLIASHSCKWSSMGSTSPALPHKRLRSCSATSARGTEAKGEHFIKTARESRGPQESGRASTLTRTPPKTSRRSTQNSRPGGVLEGRRAGPGRVLASFQISRAPRPSTACPRVSKASRRKWPHDGGVKTRGVSGGGGAAVGVGVEKPLSLWVFWSCGLALVWCAEEA